MGHTRSPRNFRMRRHARRLAVIVTTLSLLLFNFAGAAFATLPGSSFDGSDGVIPGDDGAINLVDMACGTGDDDFPINGASTKLNVIHLDEAPTINVGTMGTPKSDLCQVWMNTETVGDDFFLYLAWERFSDNGTTIVFWEFHQDELECASTAEDCNPFAGRQAGDFLLIYDFEGGAARIYIRVFDGTSFGPLVLLNDDDPNTADLAEAALSSGGDTLRGEGVVNLADAGILNPSSGECESFAGVIPGTVTGNSDTADYKDVILTDQQPGITNCGSVVVEKVVSGGNDFGDSFPITLANGGDIHSESLGHGDSFTVEDLFDDVEYSVSEDLPDGWLIDSIVCSDGSSSGADETSLSGISVTAGETTTCTVTNSPKLPTITLVKTAVGDHIVEDDFQAGLDGGDVDWDATSQVVPGDHDIAEAIADGSDVQPGWFEAGDWSCDNGDGGAAGGTTVSVGLGDEVTCSITNTELGSTLTLHKIVTNDDGGNDTQDNFQARIDGDAVDWDTVHDVEALVEHIASEDDPFPGYEQGTWTGDCAADGTVTLDPGQDGECTIVNDDIAAMVTVLKEVTNDDGGTAGPGAFDLVVDGFSHLHGDQVIVASNTQIAVGENGLTGYAQTGISCDDGTSLDGQGDVTLNLDEGEHVTCTVSNDDLPASITLVKNVVNDDGATAVADDFQALLDGNPVAWGVSVGLPAGEHFASEDTLDGYTPSDWGGDCAADGSATLENGEHLVCSITNDDLPAEIDVVKDATDGVTDDGEGNLVATFDPTDDDDETVTYTYVVTNTGDVTLENVTLVDDVLGPIELPDTTLEPGESVTVTAVHTLSADDPDTIVNVATVTGDPIHGAPAVDDLDDETVSVVEVLPEVLPETGSDTVMLLTMALLLVLGGLGVLGSQRMMVAPAAAPMTAWLGRQRRRRRGPTAGLVERRPRARRDQRRT